MLRHEAQKPHIGKGPHVHEHGTHELERPLWRMVGSRMRRSASMLGGCDPVSGAEPVPELQNRYSLFLQKMLGTEWFEAKKSVSKRP